MRRLEPFEDVGEEIGADREHGGDLDRAPARRAQVVDRLAASATEWRTALGKYRAAIDTRDRLDRTSSSSPGPTPTVPSVGASKRRSVAAAPHADAGVDLVWCELSNASREPAVAFAKAMRETHPNLPLAFNYSSSFRWHQDPHPFTFQELGALGYKLIFITLYASHAATYAVWNAMEELVRDEEQAQWRLERRRSVTRPRAIT